MVVCAPLEVVPGSTVPAPAVVAGSAVVGADVAEPEPPKALQRFEGHKL